MSMSQKGEKWKEVKYREEQKKVGHEKDKKMKEGWLGPAVEIRKQEIDQRHPVRPFLGFPIPLLLSSFFFS